MNATAMWEVWQGSSPKYSPVRPPSGVRIMFTPGPNSTCAPEPLLSASTPMAWPTRRAKSTSQVELKRTLEPNDAALPLVVSLPPRTPWLASTIAMGGTPSRATGCVVNPVPSSNVKRSSGVIASKSDFTRSSRGAAGFR